MKQIIKKHIKSFLAAAVLIFIANILSVLHPYIIKQVVDVDFKAINVEETLIKLFSAYLVIHIILAIMKNLRNMQVNKLMAKVLKDIREKLFCKVLKFKMKTYNKYNSSEIYTRLTSDADNLFDLFFGTLQILVNNVIYIVLMVIMMFFANVNLALIGCVTIVIVGYSSLKFTKKLKQLDSNILDTRDIEHREFSEMYNKNKLTYLFGLQQDNINIINKLFDKELKFRKKYIFIHHFMYPASLILEAIRNICNFILCFEYKLEYFTWKYLSSLILC